MNFVTITCQACFFSGRLAFFLGLFVQVYQRWMFWFILAFLSKSTNWETFWFILAFLSKSTNGESCVFYWHFCPSLPTVKVLFIFATVSFIGHFGYEYQWWKFCDLELAFEQSLASHSTTRESAIAEGNLWYPAVKTGVRTPGGNCWHGIRNNSYRPIRAPVGRVLGICMQVVVKHTRALTLYTRLFSGRAMCRIANSLGHQRVDSGRGPNFLNYVQ